MSEIDRQRIEGVRTLQGLGFVFREGRWVGHAPAGSSLTKEADAMHALLVARADLVEGCQEGSPEEAEFAALAEAIEAYELKRWPEGRIARGKG